MHLQFLRSSESYNQLTCFLKQGKYKMEDLQDLNSRYEELNLFPTSNIKSYTDLNRLELMITDTYHDVKQYKRKTGTNFMPLGSSRYFEQANKISYPLKCTEELYRKLIGIKQYNVNACIQLKRPPPPSRHAIKQSHLKK